MLKKFLVPLVASLVMTSGALAAEKSHALGFAAGSTYGIGLSYSHDWSKNGVQITALPYWNNDGGMVAGGVNFKRTFDENDKIGIYGSLGIAAAVQKDSYTSTTWDDEEGDGVTTKVVTISHNYAAGPGVGMQVYFWGNGVFRFELPIAFRFGTSGFGIAPIPNVALMYRWK